MSQPPRDFESSVGAMYGALGTLLVVFGAVALVNANEADGFAVIGTGLIASGAYAIIAGAVARGVQLARR